MRRLPWAIVALLAFSALTGACQKGTYLKLVFKGDGLPPVHQIQVQLTLADGRVSPGLLPKTPAAGSVVKMPASAVFIMDDYSGALGIDAVAYDATNGLIASDHKDTTIMHAKSWTVELDFAPGATPADAGLNDASVMDTTPVMDATVVEVTPSDSNSDAVDSPLFKITDGSVADNATGCVTATVQAQDSVSLDYNSSGPAMDAGNALWANATNQEHFIGWAKFGLRFIPQRTFKVTKATLNLTSTQVSVTVPDLQVRYSKVDGWTRSSMAGEVSSDDIMSAVVTAKPLAGVNAYGLDVTNHDWDTDLNDGTMTLGIENITAIAALGSRIEFAGVNKGAMTDPTRPTLDLELCR